MICRCSGIVVLIGADVEFAQRPLHRGDRFGARRAVHDQLADHAVVVRRDAVAGVDVRIQPHARAAGHAQFLDHAGRGGEIAGWVFGVDAALDRVAGLLDVLLLEATAARPTAMRICSLIRSMPVTCSVTGCSTWMRAFTSRR